MDSIHACRVSLFIDAKSGYRFLLNRCITGSMTIVNEGKLKEYAKLIRLKALGTSTTVIYGALSVKGSSLGFEWFFPLFLIAAVSHAYGFVLNDYVDVELDRTSGGLTDRPLVKGTVTKKNARRLIFTCLILGIGIPMVFLRNPLTIGVFLSAWISGTIYDLFGKKFFGSDIFVAMGVSLGCLFGALVVSDHIRNLSEIPYLTWVISGASFIQMLYMNIVDGGLKDADHDYKAKVRTLAVACGVKADKEMIVPMKFKAFALVLGSFSVILAFLPFVFIDARFKYWQIPILLVIVGFLYTFTIRMLNMTSFDRERIRDYIGIVELLRYFLVPVMLMAVIGPGWSLLLMLLPFGWYALSTFIMYGKPLKRANIL